MKVRDRILSWATLLCFVAGAALGLLRPDWAAEIGFLGSAYVTALKYLALPVLILSVFRAALGGRDAAGLLARALAVFVILFTLSFLLCAALFTAAAPGRGFPLTGDALWQGQPTAVTLGSVLGNIFSPDRLRTFNGLYFPAILLSLILGLALGLMKFRRLEKAAAWAEELVRKLLSWVLLFTPVGVFSLMAGAAGSFGRAALRSCGVYIAWAYAGCGLVLFLVMILPLWVFCKVSPGRYFRGTGRLFLTALSTCSSAATLPETMRTCREAFGASRQTTGIVAPLGCTIHMCGGAVSFSLLGLFVLQTAGQQVTGGTLLMMLLFALLLNMGAPGIPGGGIVLGATYLGMLGVEHAELFLGMYAGIYRLLDMAYTSLNVAGDVTANLLIDRWGRKP